MTPSTKNPLDTEDVLGVVRQGLGLLVDRVKDMVMDKKLRTKVDEFERQLKAGEVKFVSHEETQRRLAVLRAKHKEIRKRFASK